MPTPKRPRRHAGGLKGFLDARDRTLRLDRFRLAPRFGRPLVPFTRDDIAIPEPDEELEGSELTDAERAAAMDRERTRRQGLD